MTTIDALLALSTSPVGYGLGGGTLVAALVPLVRAIPGALRRVLDVWAAAKEKRATAEADRAAADRTVDETMAAMLSRYETRLTQAEQDMRELREESRKASEAAKAAEERAEAAEEKAANAEKRVDACEQRHAHREREIATMRRTIVEQAAEIVDLNRRLDKLTPQPMAAVKEKR